MDNYELIEEYLQECVNNDIYTEDFANEILELAYDKYITESGHNDILDLVKDAKKIYDKNKRSNNNIILDKAILDLQGIKKKIDDTDMNGITDGAIHALGVFLRRFGIATAITALTKDKDSYINHKGNAKFAGILTAAQIGGEELGRAKANYRLRAEGNDKSYYERVTATKKASMAYVTSLIVKLRKRKK